MYFLNIGEDNANLAIPSKLWHLGIGNKYYMKNIQYFLRTSTGIKTYGVVHLKTQNSLLFRKTITSDNNVNTTIKFINNEQAVSEIINAFHILKNQSVIPFCHHRVRRM